MAAKGSSVVNGIEQKHGRTGGQTVVSEVIREGVVEKSNVLKPSEGIAGNQRSGRK